MWPICHILSQNDQIYHFSVLLFVFQSRSCTLCVVYFMSLMEKLLHKKAYRSKIPFSAGRCSCLCSFFCSSDVASSPRGSSSTLSPQTVFFLQFNFGCCQAPILFPSCSDTAADNVSIQESSVYCSGSVFSRRYRRLQSAKNPHPGPSTEMLLWSLEALLCRGFDTLKAKCGLSHLGFYFVVKIWVTENLTGQETQLITQKPSC